MTVRTFGFLAAAAASAATVVAPAPAAAQQTIKMTFVCGHPPIFPWARHYLNTLIPAIDKSLAKNGKYKIEWNKAFGGALAKVSEEFEVISEGIADMGQSLSLFEPAKMPLQNVGYYAPFQPTEPEPSVIVMEDLQKRIPALGAQWEKQNQTYVGGGIAIDVFNLWTKFPVRRVEDLKGHKIGGAPPTANWLRGTGAVHVITNMATNYNNLKTGLMEGVILFVTGALPARYHDVAPYITVVNLASPYSGGITVNSAKWAKLPEEVRAAIRAGTAIHHKALYGELKTRLAKSWKAQEKTKAKIYRMPEAERVRWAKMLPPLGKEWVETLEKRGLPARQVLNGYMDGLRKMGMAFPRDWDKE